MRCGDHLPPHKYTENTSTCGTTPTEHLLNAARRPQTSQKARNHKRTWPVAVRVLVLWPAVRPEPLRLESQVQDIGSPETSRPHVISISESSHRDLHLNTQTHLHDQQAPVLDTLCQTTSKTGTQPHPLAERLPKIIIRSQTPQNTPSGLILPTRKTRSSIILQNTGTSPLHQEAYTNH